MATMKELEAQVASLTERMQYVENKLLPGLSTQRKLDERRARRDRLRALDLDGYTKLTSAERDEWAAVQTDEQLVALLLDAKPKLRDEVLNRVTSWERKARVVFGLAPAPSLVRVHNPQGYRSKPLPLTAAQANALEAVGMRVTKRERHGVGDLVYSLPPTWASYNGDTVRELVFDSATWDALLAVDAGMAQLVADGKLLVSKLNDDASRRYAAERYVTAYRDLRDLAGGNSHGPSLPDLSN